MKLETEKAQSGAVLVVDDDEVIRTTCERVLKRSGYAVGTASSGEAGLAAMEQQAAEVVLTDIRMPGISGIEVLRAVKQKWPWTEVLVMTAFADQDLASESLKLGAGEILIKPFNQTEPILHAVAKAMIRAKIRRQGYLDDSTLELLVRARELCAEADLAKAQAHARTHNLSLRKALGGLGIVSEQDLDYALAQFMEIPYVRIQEKMLDSVLLSTFPALLARKYRCLPLWKENETLHLLMRDPFDAEAIGVMEKALRLKIKPAQGVESEIAEFLEKAYGGKFSGLALEELGSQLLKSSGPESDRILAALFGQTELALVQEASLLKKGDDLYELKLSALLKTAARPGERKRHA